MVFLIAAEGMWTSSRASRRVRTGHALLHHPRTEGQAHSRARDGDTQLPLAHHVCLDEFDGAPPRIQRWRWQGQRKLEKGPGQGTAGGHGLTTRSYHTETVTFFTLSGSRVVLIIHIRAQKPVDSPWMGTRPLSYESAGYAVLLPSTRPGAAKPHLRGPRQQSEEFGTRIMRDSYIRSRFRPCRPGQLRVGDPDGHWAAVTNFIM
jgi:hypothetical protein